MKTILRTLMFGTALTLAPVAVTLAVPSIAHAEIKPDALGQLPSITNAAVSPDGNRVAVYGYVGDAYGVRILDLDDPSNVVGFKLTEDAKPGYLIWASNDRLLAQAWQTQLFRREFPVNVASLFTYDVKSGKGDWLITPERYRANSRMGSKDPVFEFDYSRIVDVLPNDPDHVLLSFANETTGVRPVHKVNVNNSSYRTLEKGTDDVYRWATDNTGTVRVAVGRYGGETSREKAATIRILDTDGEWKAESNWPGLGAETSFFGFTNTPHEMVIGDYNGRNTKGLHVYDLDQKRITRTLYQNPRYDVSGVVRDPKTREVIGARFTGEESTTVLLPGKDSVSKQLSAKFPDYQIQIYDTADDGQTVLFKLSQPYDPGILMLQRKGASGPVKLGEVMPEIDPDELGMVVPVNYTARDGATIPAFITLPPTIADGSGLRNLPFIVLPHGGPYSRDAMRFDWFAQFFASRGYGVLQMNFRGSTGYGKAFSEAGRKDWSVMRSDVIDGAKWLADKGYSDPDRTCVAGWSYGGYAALMSGVEEPDMFNCVISIAALSDLEGQLRRMRFSRNRSLNEKIIRDGFPDMEAIRAGSPIRIVDAMTLPTFIAHGTLDVNVDYDQHKKLVMALKKSPAKVTEMTFKEDDHYMSVEANRQKMLREIAKFLDEVNGPSEYMKK